MKKRIVFKVLIILILYVMLFPYTMVYAATSAEAGLYVASFAKNFLEKHSIVWECGHGLLGENYGTKYYSECVGFVRYMYSQAINYKNYGTIPFPSGNRGIYNNPANTTVGNESSDFELVAVNDLSKAIPGDIIENYHHDMLYIGTVNNISGVIANNGKNSSKDPLANGLITMAEYQVSHTSSFSNWDYCPGNCNFRIWRLKEEAAAKLGDVSTFNAGGDLVAAGTSLVNTQNMSNFYYNGIPDGKYSVTKGFFERLIESLSEIFDFLIGLMTMVIRMVFVGWTAIFETLITSTVKTVSGDGDIISVPVTSTDIESNENISIEKIVFNQISVFDVNFFNFNDQNNP